MAPRGALFQHLSDLEQAASRERQLARQRLHQQRSGEILTTYMAYPLKVAAERMGKGMAIGDAVLLVHVDTNAYDPNAIEVRWQEQWIGFIPRHLAALLVQEMPELSTGVAAVITELATTSERDAFRLQLSIPIERASERVKALAINAGFSWDFDRERGSDKLRLVVRCSEKDLRDLQAVLRPVATISKSGYSYYPLADGRSFPWYLSLTALDGGPFSDTSLIEEQIRNAFGEASESTLLEERNRSFQQQSSRLESISERLRESRLEEQRLLLQVKRNKRTQERRQAVAEEQKLQALELAGEADRDRDQLRGDLDVALQELDLAHQAAVTMQLELEEQQTAFEQLEGEYLYLQSQLGQQSRSDQGALDRNAPQQGPVDAALEERLLAVVRGSAARQSPRQILELVDGLCPGNLRLLPSALKAADEASGFEYGEKLFDLVWKLATEYHQLRMQGGPDVVGQQVFGNNTWAAHEAETTARAGANNRGTRERTFEYKGKPVLMLQHLKIGVKDSINRTLRLHFEWDGDDGVVVIGHCGRHLHVEGH